MAKECVYPAVHSAYVTDGQSNNPKTIASTDSEDVEMFSVPLGDKAQSPDDKNIKVCVVRLAARAWQEGHSLLWTGNDRRISRASHLTTPPRRGQTKWRSISAVELSAAYVDKRADPKKHGPLPL